jgi:hypothetical protein
MHVRPAAVDGGAAGWGGGDGKLCQEHINILTVINCRHIQHSSSQPTAAFQHAQYPDPQATRQDLGVQPQAMCPGTADFQLPQHTTMLCLQHC